MNKLIQLLQLRFLPYSVDLGLLALRVWFGLSLVLLHGWGKLMKFSELSRQFPDPLGVGSQLSLTFALAGEVIGSIFLVIGLFTRLSALGCAITMAVAFFVVHKGSLAMGPGSGELAFVYLGVFVSLIIAGPGRFSVDAILGKDAVRQ